METPTPSVLDLKRQESELEAELKLALGGACQEAGIRISTKLAIAALLRTFASEPVTVDKLGQWFISTRAIRRRLQHPKLILDVQQSSVAPEEHKPESNAISVHDRLRETVPLDINLLNWDELIAVHGTEHANDDSSEKDASTPVEVNINSGGVVYFALFREGAEESAACIKFTPSRITTQSERLGLEIARHLGVAIPQASIIRRGSSEWQKLMQATEKVKAEAASSDDADTEKTCCEMLEALHLNRCLLLMGYINGSSFLESQAAFASQVAAERTAAALGKVFLLDLVLRNEDRLPCQQLGWRGNARNLLCTEQMPFAEPIQTSKVELKLPSLPRRSRGKALETVTIAKTSGIPELVDAGFYLVAIDSGVPRRPPTHKRDHDKEQFPKLVEMILNDTATAATILFELSGGKLGGHLEGANQSKQLVNCFRSGFRSGLKRLVTLRQFLTKLHRRLDYYMMRFVADISELLQSDSSPEKCLPGSAASPPTATHSPRLERRITLQLKDFSKLAKVDEGIHDRVQHWDKVLQTEGCKLAQAYGFMTGFLENDDSHSFVDSYELKVRLQHVLERVDLILQGAETERPSQVLNSLYVGGSIAAKSLNTLRSIGITSILCLCPIESGPPDADVLNSFRYKACHVLDIEEEDIAKHFDDACSFIETAEQNGGKTLVHCFEGKSRSPTIVLMYLMKIKGMALADAWNLLKAAHPRTRPNDGFMRALAEMEQQLYGVSSMDWQRRRPVSQVCPVCGKNVGLSSEALRHHMQRLHLRS